MMATHTRTHARTHTPGDSGARESTYADMEIDLADHPSDLFLAEVQPVE